MPGALPGGHHDVRQDVHRVPQRGHLKLDGDQPQLLDGAGAADVAPADERDGLAPPLHERPVHGILQHRRVAVVVFGGRRDEPVRPVQRAAEPLHLRARVLAGSPRRGDSVEERQRMITQVDLLDVDVLAGLQLLDHPGGDFLAEAALAGGAGDDLNKHVCPVQYGVLP
jgi:hypothetical protein